jgi:hypothetical protein
LTFAQNPAASPFEVRSAVVSRIFRSLLSALEDTAVEVRYENITGLSAFGGEFGFGFAIRLFRRWRMSPISWLEAEVAQK